MNSEYILTSSGTFISTDELYHHGILGQKWGVRRYQNADGTLTELGRKRYTNSDGTFNKKGEKYIAKETARLKSEKTRLENQKKSNAQLNELTKMRKVNQDLEDEINGKKTTDSEVKDTSDKVKVNLAKAYDMSQLSDKEVNDIKNRLQSEENLKDLLTKRGYNVSLDEKSEIDAMIDSLSKEKKLKELQKDLDKLTAAKTETEKRIEILTQKRDIAKLEKEIRDNTPKKENKLSKFMNSQAGQNLTSKLIQSGENIAKEYIKNKTGTDSDKKSDNTSGKKTKDLTKGTNVDKITEAAVNEIDKNVGGTLRKAASDVGATYERTKAAESRTAAKNAAKELNDLVTKASKNSDASYYSTKAYEAKVDNLLADMDDQAWDYYYEHYVNK